MTLICHVLKKFQTSMDEVQAQNVRVSVQLFLLRIIADIRKNIRSGTLKTKYLFKLRGYRVELN